MDWNAVSAISETIASLAVVVSLIYLAIQIKQANKLSQGHTRVELRHMAQAEVFKIIDYPELVQAYTKEELTEEEAIRLHNFLITALRFREFIWRQHQQGLLDTPTFENYSLALPQVLGSQRCRKWWDNYKVTTLDPAFVDFVDNFLQDNPEVNMLDLYKNL
jgi:hypothetical protein